VAIILQLSIPVLIEIYLIINVFMASFIRKKKEKQLKKDKTSTVESINTTKPNEKIELAKKEEDASEESDDTPVSESHMKKDE